MKSLVCSKNRDHVVPMDAKSNDACSDNDCDGTIVEKTTGTDATLIANPPPPVVELPAPPPTPKPRRKPELELPPAEEDGSSSLTWCGSPPAAPELPPDVALPPSDVHPGPATAEAMEDVGMLQPRRSRIALTLVIGVPVLLALVAAFLLVVGPSRDTAPATDDTTAAATGKKTAPAQPATTQFAADCTYNDDGTTVRVRCESTEVKDDFTIEISWLPADEQPVAPRALAILSTTINGRAFKSGAVEMTEQQQGNLGQIVFATK